MNLIEEFDREHERSKTAGEENAYFMFWLDENAGRIKAALEAGQACSDRLEEIDFYQEIDSTNMVDAWENAIK